MAIFLELPVSENVPDFSCEKPSCPVYQDATVNLVEGAQTTDEAPSEKLLHNKQPRNQQTLVLQCKVELHTCLVKIKGRFSKSSN